MHFLPSCLTRFFSHLFLLMFLCLVTLAPASNGLAADFEVTNLNDSGAGSLRQALASAGDGDRIVVSPSLSGTITLASVLPTLNSIEFVNAQGVKLSMPNGNINNPPLLVARSKTIGGTLPSTITQKGTGQLTAIHGEGALTFADEMSSTVSSTSLDSHALGVIAMSDLTFEKDISGSILAQGPSPSTGLFAGRILSLKSLSGSIEARSSSAYGISGSDGVIIQDDVSGSIFAAGKDGQSRGIESEQNISIGSFSGSIFASGGWREGGGIWADKNLNINGPLSGDIVVSSKAIYYSGLHAGRDMKIGGDLSGSISVKGPDVIFGISSSNLTIEGDLSGSIAATASSGRALGIYSQYNTSIGSLSGSVSAVATEGFAYAFYGEDSRINGDMSGAISALAPSSAYGFGANSFLLKGVMSGSIVATSTGSAAYGINAASWMTFNDVLSGSIEATAQRDAFGLIANGDLTFDNGLTGSVTAVSRGGYAYGIYAYNDLLLSNGLSGKVSATSGGAYAYGLISYYDGKIDGNGVPLDISGSVSASANGRAVAVSAPQGLNLNVTGSLHATDTSGSGKAYAIRAGTYDWRTNNWIPGGAVNDTIVLGNGASVVGKIDLGGGTNLLTLGDSGSLNGDVSNITTMTKTGAGTWSTNGEINTNDLAVQGGTLKVNVAQTATPTVQVANNFINNGDVAFALGGLTQSGESFTALTSANLSGTGSYSTNSPLLNVSIAGNNVNLTKKSYMDVVDMGNENAVAMAAVLDPLTATATGDMATILGKLDCSASQQAFNTNLTELGGVFSSGMTTISLGTAHQLSLATQTRMAQMRAYQIMLAQNDETVDSEDPESWPMVAANGDLVGIMSREPEYQPNGVHLRVLGRTGNMDSHGGYDGYDYNSVIFSGGYDRVLRDGFLAGVSGGYARTDADYKDEGGSDSSLDSYSLGVYGTWFKDQWYVDAVLAGAYNQYDMDRRLAAFDRTATSDSSGYTVSAKSAGGYRFDVNGYGLTPTASLEYTRFHQDGYTESGAGAANLSVPDVDSNFLESGLGVKLDRTWHTDFGQIIPELSAMWMHEWFTQDRALTVSMTGMPGTVFSQTTAETARDAYRFGAGVRAIYDTNMSLALRYQGDVEEHAASHSLMCEAQFLF